MYTVYCIYIYSIMYNVAVYSIIYSVQCEYEGICTVERM